MLDDLEHVYAKQKTNIYQFCAAGYCHSIILLFHLTILLYNLTPFSSHLQCVLFSANIEPAARMTSAATTNAWAAVWSPTQLATAWPAVASSTKATAWSAALKTTSSTKAGAASPPRSARSFTTNASRRRSRAKAPNAASMSSIMVPASPSVPLATQLSTPPRKWTLKLAWWALDLRNDVLWVSFSERSSCTHANTMLEFG